MNLSVEETGPLERRLQIEVSTADVDRAFDAFYRDVGKQAHLKGFRKGKVPRAILEKHYGDHARGEVLQTLVRESLFQAIEQAQLDIVTEPRLEPEEPPSQGTSFSYHAMVEIRPEVRLEKVEGLEIEAWKQSEPEEDPVAAYLEQVREGQAQLTEEDEGVAAAQGHVAVIDFEGSIDGEPFEGGRGEEVTFEIGAGRAVPGFEEALVGLAVGDEKRFEVTFPEDYGAEAVAGKLAEFRVSLKELKRKELPDLDDELAKDVSEFETLEAWRADVSRRVEEGRDAERKRVERERVLDALVAANPFPLPPTLVDSQLEAMVERMLEQLGDQVPAEQRDELGAQWREQTRERATRDTALAFLIPKIADAHDLSVSDEQVEERVGEIAEQQGVSRPELMSAYREQNGLERLRAGLLEERVVEFLVSKAILDET